MKNIISFFILVVFYQTQAQTYKEQFVDAASKNDTAMQRLVLKKWEKENSNDAELYMAYFHFYKEKNNARVVALAGKPKEKRAVQLISKDSVKDEEIFLFEETYYYDPEELRQSFRYLNKGLEKFPARLDIRFAKMHLLNNTKNYKPLTNEIITMIHYADKIKNAWLWTDNEVMSNPQAVMLGAIESWNMEMYNTEKDSLLMYTKLISETVLMYYPDNAVFLLDLGSVYIFQRDYGRALEALLKAEKSKPEDPIILNFIATAYELKEDWENAIRYKKKEMKYLSKGAQKSLKEEIKSLKKEQKKSRH